MSICKIESLDCLIVIVPLFRANVLLRVAGTGWKIHDQNAGNVWGCGVLVWIIDKRKLFCRKRGRDESVECREYGEGGEGGEKRDGRKKGIAEIK